MCYAVMMPKPSKPKRKKPPQPVPVVRAAKAFVGEPVAHEGQVSDGDPKARKPTRRRIKQLAAELVDWDAENGSR